MEVFPLSTPTSSGNYKAFLEALQDEPIFICGVSPTRVLPA
jgi:hypothetical protein